MLADWLAFTPVDWLTGLLVDRLDGLLADWLTGLLAGFLAGRPGRLAGWLADWMSGRLTGLVSGWLAGRAEVQLGGLAVTSICGSGSGKREETERKGCRGWKERPEVRPWPAGRRAPGRGSLDCRSNTQTGWETHRIDGGQNVVG